MRLLLLLSIFLLAGCSALVPRPDGVAPGRIWSVAEGRWIDADTLNRRIAGADYLLLGEVHDSREAHEWQARLLAAFATEGRSPALVLEQMNRDRQTAIDAAQGVEALLAAGGLAEGGWRPDFYRPLLALAEGRGLRVLAGNLPREALKSEDRLPERVRTLAGRPWPEAMRRRLARDIERAHCGVADAALVERLVAMQHRRDAALALTLRDAGRPAVLIAGNGHVRRDYGVPTLLPAQARTVVVATLEVERLRRHPLQYPAVALGAVDYAIFVPRVRETDPCEHFRRQLEGMKARD